jgi:hypothetical protein
MSQRNSEYEREPLDTYQTPPWLAGTVADYLRTSGARKLWEPCPPPQGDSKLATALKALGFDVLTSNGDFLDWRKPFPAVDAICTNPPYGGRGSDLAAKFIRHALTLDIRVCAFLMRVDFDSGKTRRDVFADCPSFVGKITLLDRIVWFDRPGAAPSENHAWFLWNKDGGEPIIRYAARPR